MKQLHDIQLQILKKLLFAKELRYSELKPDSEMENNQFDFHLDKLVSQKFIEKNSKFYYLTNAGKEYANRMDTDKDTIPLQSKISVFICPTRLIKGRTQYLIYTRLKQPFYGCQGFMSGKVRYGETIIDGAKRELLEETSLMGNPQLVSIRHYLVFEKSSKALVEDKFMFFCLVKNPTGELVPNNEGKYEWINEPDLPNHITYHFENYAAFERDLKEIKDYNGQVKFTEYLHESEKF